jgi:hypothetical protein
MLSERRLILLSSKTRTQMNGANAATRQSKLIPHRRGGFARQSRIERELSEPFGTEEQACLFPAEKLWRESLAELSAVPARQSAVATVFGPSNAAAWQVAVTSNGVSGRVYEI